MTVEDSGLSLTNPADRAQIDGALMAIVKAHAAMDRAGVSLDQRLASAEPAMMENFSPREVVDMALLAIERLAAQHNRMYRLLEEVRSKRQGGTGVSSE